MVTKNHVIAIFALSSVIVSACEADDEGGSPTDASVGTSDDGAASDSGRGPGGGDIADAANTSGQLISTLRSDCGAGFQGRAVVNVNSNLGISFSEDSGAFTFLGSIQFELPSGFRGKVANPENWDRQVVAVTTESLSLHGNHCWFDAIPQNAGSLTISEYRPGQGIVKAEFSDYRLRSCTGTSVCTINGSIETMGEGVFD